MDTYSLKRYVGKDGILKIEVPVGVSETEVEVVIVVQNLELENKSSSPDVPDKIQRIRKKHPRAYEPWTDEEEQQLVQLQKDGYTDIEIAKILQRQPGAIKSCIQKIEEGLEKSSSDNL